MNNESLSDKLERARSRSPLTDEEIKKSLESIDKLHLRMQVNDIRMNILNKLMYEDDIYFDGTIHKEDYQQISKEWENISEILNKDCLKRIGNLIEIEKINNPNNYLSSVEDKMIKREYKIREFFTFNRYLDRRRNNLDKDPIEFIKEMALKNEAYEFFDALK